MENFLRSTIKKWVKFMPEATEENFANSLNHGWLVVL